MHGQLQFANIINLKDQHALRLRVAVGSISFVTMHGYLLCLILSAPEVGMQEQAEYSATYLMHAEHAKLAAMEKRNVDGVV